MTPWEAAADQLIAAGWGEVERRDIPSDWQTRRPPETSNRWKGKPAARPKRLSWQQRRALYLLENAAGEVLEGR